MPASVPSWPRKSNLAGAPEAYVTKDARGKDVAGYKFRMQLSPLDCTGCGNCADVCPAKEKALVMQPLAEVAKTEEANWDFAIELPRPDINVNKNTVIGSQYLQPLFEFSGACAGCGETPYIKLATQLFGDRMIIANATGCSSIYGGSAPTCPYTKNEEGHGPAWANSLFEDNAEFGYGINLSMTQRRNGLKEKVEKAVADGIVSGALKDSMVEWTENMQEADITKACAKVIKAELPAAIAAASGDAKALLEEIQADADLFIKKSIWIIGGDGWAYDIGYGGLDHVLAMGEDVNVLVVDTEVYSNTGGQASKASPTGAVAKFAAAGKRVKKKDLGAIAMTYGYVYVAQCAMGANQAPAHQGHDRSGSLSWPVPHHLLTLPASTMASTWASRRLEEKKAVEAGYWQLYRYNPTLAAEGKNPFTLDSKDPTASYQDFIMGETRYKTLKKMFPADADRLFQQAEEEAKERLEGYKARAGK